METTCRIYRRNKRLSVNVYKGYEHAECIKNVANHIKTDKSIVYFEIYNAGDDEIVIIADALKYNTTIKQIYMQGRGPEQYSMRIGPKGAKAVADMLKHNSTIEILSMYNNKIGDEGAKYFAEALKINTTLKELYLDSNDISSEIGVAVLRDGLKNNSSITQISVGGIYNDYFSDITKRNKRIENRVNVLSKMIEKSTHMEYGGVLLPKDMRKFVAQYVKKSQGNWLK